MISYGCILLHTPIRVIVPGVVIRLIPYGCVLLHTPIRVIVPGVVIRVIPHGCILLHTLIRVIVPGVVIRVIPHGCILLHARGCGCTRGCALMPGCIFLDVGTGLNAKTSLFFFLSKGLHSFSLLSGQITVTAKCKTKHNIWIRSN